MICVATEMVWDVCSSTLFSAGGGSPGSVLRSADQLAEVVSLAHALLPPLPDSATVLLEDQPTVPDLDLCELPFSLQTPHHRSLSCLYQNAPSLQELLARTGGSNAAGLGRLC